MNRVERFRGSVLVLGSRGMLGRELVRQLQGRAGESKELHVSAWGSEELDLRNREAVLREIPRFSTGIVINAAAYTDVDGCERNREHALAVNSAGPGFLAEVCRESGATLVHFSTDFVFDGASSRPYRPNDVGAPVSAYGESKWQGELAIRRVGIRHLIIRTSWLFGVGGKNFVEAILARAQSGQPLKVVTDQIGRPTFTVDLADATLAMLEAGAEGTMHFANEGECTWHEFAVEIVRQAGLSVPVGMMTSDQLDRPARRPVYSVLDTAGYTELTGRSIPTWREALRRYLELRGAAA
ncbi:MAG: dTDP-4-dehydrorhamnose reductase [Planctomycetota bacterium]